MKYFDYSLIIIFAIIALISAFNNLDGTAFFFGFLTFLSLIRLG